MSYHSSWSLDSLIYRIVFYILLLPSIFADVLSASETLDVKVTGVQGKAYENIMSGLRINRLSERGDDLDELEIKRLHRLAPRDIEAALAPYGYHSVQVESNLNVTDTGWKASYDVDPSLLAELQRDFYRTGYFNRVSVTPEIGGEHSPYVPVIVSAQPRESATSVSLGVGYATDTGANVRLDYQNRLLNRKGHSAFSSLLLGNQQSLVQLNYRVPGPDPRFTSVTGTGGWNREFWEDTETEKISAGIIYEYNNSPRFGAFSLQYFDEDYKVGETSGTGKFLMPGLTGSMAIANDLIHISTWFRGLQHKNWR